MGDVLLEKDMTVPIKSLHHAKVILEAAWNQKANITFTVGGYETVVVTPLKGGKYAVSRSDGATAAPGSFQQSLEVSREEAIQFLYGLRKHFNKKYV